MSVITGQVKGSSVLTPLAVVAGCVLNSKLVNKVSCYQKQGVDQMCQISCTAPLQPTIGIRKPGCIEMLSDPAATSNNKATPTLALLLVFVAICCILQEEEECDLSLQQTAAV